MRIFKILAIAATMLVACTSCMKEKEQNYVFGAVCSANNTVSDADFTAMSELVKDVQYFNDTHSYFGYYYDVVQLAANDFQEACKQVDAEAIMSHLKSEETFMVTLVANDTGEVIMYYVVTPDSSASE